ncbi:MAG: translation initiation factor eIF-1A [Candidatus Woesearchaeota archaeon]
MEVGDKLKAKGAGENVQFEEDISRVKLPKGTQTMGILEQRLGGSRCNVRCLDGKTRVCRIPGRLKRRLWVRVGDVVLVEPWEFSGETRGDIIFKYKPTQIQWLKSKGLLDKLENEEEF